MIPNGLRIYLADEPADMRKQIKGLTTLATRFIDEDPNALFVFVNKRRDRLKVLWRDKTGWCLLYKVLNKKRRIRLPEPKQKRIDTATLAYILDGVAKKQSAREIAREARKKVRTIL